jgi:hypothetical protein
MMVRTIASGATALTLALGLSGCADPYYDSQSQYRYPPQQQQYYPQQQQYYPPQQQYYPPCDARYYDCTPRRR